MNNENMRPIPPNRPPARDIPASGEYRPPDHVKGAWIFEDQINANIRGTFFLMMVFIFFLTAVVWAAGQLYAPHYAYLLAGAAALVTFFTSYYSYFNSDKLVLSLSHARPATKEEFPYLLNTLEGLTLAAGLPSVPRAFVIDDMAPNAFATGRDPQHSAIAVTTGLLRKLNRYQLEGVLAHEMSHIGNRDVLLSTIAAVMVGTIVLLSDWLWRTMWFSGGGRRRSNDREGGNSGTLGAVLMIVALITLILAPFVAQLLRLAVSRKREYLADANAIKLTRYPDGLAGALLAIAKDPAPLAVANKATAHLFIANPLHDHGGWLNSLFSTHPPIEERVARLERM